MKRFQINCICSMLYWQLLNQLWEKNWAISTLKRLFCRIFSNNMRRHRKYISLDIYYSIKTVVRISVTKFWWQSHICPDIKSYLMDSVPHRNWLLTGPFSYKLSNLMIFKTEIVWSRQCFEHILTKDEPFNEWLNDILKKVFVEQRRVC